MADRRAQQKVRMVGAGVDMPVVKPPLQRCPGAWPSRDCVCARAVHIQVREWIARSQGRAPDLGKQETPSKSSGGASARARSEARRLASSGQPALTTPAPRTLAAADVAAKQAAAVARRQKEEILVRSGRGAAAPWQEHELMPTTR